MNSIAKPMKNSFNGLRITFLITLSAVLIRSVSLEAQSATAVPPVQPSASAQPAASPAEASPASASYVPHRVYDSKRKRFIDLESMIAAVAKADAAFLGEFHDDPGTHRLQAAILEGLARRRSDTLVLAMEMFERDVQPQVDAYLRSEIDEPTFLAQSRPWSNYPSDYRPLVELAKAQGWPVVGGNVPRRIASMVARGGLSALDSLPASDREYVAADHSCPRDDYFKRFQGVMGDMSGHGMQLTPEQVDTMVWRTYEAQCVKDEAMGEAVAKAIAERATLVVHPNGSFHSDYRLGTVARVRRRAPRAKLVVVTFLPVSDLDAANGRPHRKQADYIVFTLAPAKDASTGAP